jgi:putative peptidoglycan lipid II flippase
MAFATLISRITGFIRILLLAAILGAALSSAFSVANQLPNLVAALVLEATFTAIFVPVLARAERDDSDGGAAFVRRLVTMATTVLLVATALSVAAAPPLVRLMLGADPQVNQPLTTAFAYLLLPQVIFYGLSSVFMAILNTRNVFGAPAWAPVVNNVVAIATLGLYLLVPGELSVDPVRMGNTKLLVLGVGTTLGVFAQTAVLLVAIFRERISLRPMWGIDERLKKFGAMAAAMVLYVLISQIGLVVGNQIASTAAASGPAIYNYTWLVLMLPFGMIGVTILTVVMPRLSRNAAAEDIPAVLADLSLATRLTMVTLIPTVAFMTVAGPAIGSALFAYGKFGNVDAGYLGIAISLSAFTLLPYGLVLLELRVFYAREQPWTPIVLIVVITTVKITASFIAPHLTTDRELVAGYLGLANGLGFLAGAIVGYVLLHRNLHPPGGRLIDIEVVRTILVAITASLAAGVVAHTVDWLFGLPALTDAGGGFGSMLRLLALGLIMLPIICGVMLAARVPDAEAALQAVRRRLPVRLHPASRATAGSAGEPGPGHLTYSEHRNSLASRRRSVPATAPRGPWALVPGVGMRKGRAVTDPTVGGSAASPSVDATRRMARPAADQFRPDTPTDFFGTAELTTEHQVGGPSPVSRARETEAFDAPRQQPGGPSDEGPLLPGTAVCAGRYRLLVCHGSTALLQFWQALDTNLDRQVALTFIDPEGKLPQSQVQDILSRTQQLGKLNKAGLARVLDASRLTTGGLVVSEWIRGGSLAEVAGTSPSSHGSARATQSLASAAAAAHQDGIALSIDHPSRVRVSIDGDMALAFPACMPDATPEDDIRGIGAALYALLVSRWPLPGPSGGLAHAVLNAAGQPVEPRSLDRHIPFQISAAAIHAVQPGGGIRSASTLLNLLEQATSSSEKTDLIDQPDPPATKLRREAEVDPAVRARRQRSVLIVFGVGGAILLVAFVVLASVLGRMFGGVGSLDKNQLGLNAPTSVSAPSGSNSGTLVKPARVTVFSPQPDPDNPDQASLALDGSGKAWSTETYTDAVPFAPSGAFKTGEGLLLQLPQPTKVATVSLNVSSTGTVIQLRAASSSTPTKLEDTTELTPPTPMTTGLNTITVKNPTSTSNLLVWITTLGTVDGKSKTDLSGITVKAAS